MDYPPRLAQIADALYTANAGLTTGTDDQQRLFVRLVAEQAAFEKGPLYGVKSAGAGRPQGPSQIAYNDPAGLGGWRIIDNDGRVTGTLGKPIPNPPWQSFAGQVFIAVDPVDHLSVSATTPTPRSYPPPADPLPPAVNLQPILDQLQHLEALITVLGQELMAQRAMLDHPPTYRTALFGVAIVLKPGPP